MTGNSVSIQLDMSRNSHGPIFLNDSCVAGTVVIDNCNSAQFDSVRVILEGTIRNSLGPSARTYAQASRMEMKQKVTRIAGPLPIYTTITPTVTDTHMHIIY
ncbi:hypothetical protein I7I50_08140 [Histoplasma capsulatum G186AR]|uniref:Uncharacterized protein n=1 Tax=Ajellomyces capsulatus TaxID=5037 RepID=A0A8H7YFD0_AJECA|nr:hypothetical protein I7I52_08656 [Histoplasma capsulatum]QSS68658.1 hypothetical protein I7I50_08140 [Histoplasma capsulatum G186AR]